MFGRRVVGGGGADLMSRWKGIPYHVTYVMMRDIPIPPLRLRMVKCIFAVNRGFNI